MPHISDEWLQELYNRINIADLISNYVSLQNKSGRLWACCPFHNEKTPSFSVNPSKGLYYCFGCGKGGNAIQFIMDIEHLTFPEACIFIAERINLPLPQDANSKTGKNNKTLKAQILDINKIARDYFINSLIDNTNKNALEYIKERNLDKSLIKRFFIGYAPDNWDSLYSFLKNKGFSDDLIVKSGLARQKSGNLYDYFRNRIIFPIVDTHDDIIAFGGRAIDDSSPKYLNSPETLVFNKSHNLYNLNNVKAIKDLSSIILTEGYMDVIALSKYGFNNAVATLGTAITPYQARLLKRYSENIYISYDGDEAGQKATIRAIEIFKNEGVDCKVICLPDNMDPDDYLAHEGSRGYNKLIEQAKHEIKFKIDLNLQKYNLKDGEQKEKFAKECIEILKQEKSSVIKEKYGKYIADLTGFSISSIMQDANGSQENITNENSNINRILTAEDTDTLHEDYIIMRLAENMQLMDVLKNELSAGLFWNKTNRDIYNFLFIQNKIGNHPVCSEILSIADDENERNRVSKLLMSTDITLSQGKRSYQYLLDNIRKLYIRNKEAELNSYYSLLNTTADQDGKIKLNKEIAKISKELYNLKENNTN